MKEINNQLVLIIELLLQIDNTLKQINLKLPPQEKEEGCKHQNGFHSNTKGLYCNNCRKNFSSHPKKEEVGEWVEKGIVKE